MREICALAKKFALIKLDVLMHMPRIIDPAFEPRFCRWLLHKAREVHANGGGNGFKPVKGRWEDMLLEASNAPILVFDVLGMPRDFILAHLREREVVAEGEHTLVVHAGPPGSCINWHCDSFHHSAATIYLNEHWDAAWGGQFLYRLDRTDEPTSITPSFNKAVCIETPLEHRTVLVTEEAQDVRYSLQVFTAGTSNAS